MLGKIQMNKKQLAVLGIGIAVICIIILTAPKYIYIPHQGTFSASEISNPYNSWEYKQDLKKYEQKISWDWVLQKSLPIILVGGFLIYLLRNPIKFPKIPKAFLTFLKYSIAIIISAGFSLVIAFGVVYIFSLKQFSPVQPQKKINLDFLPVQPTDSFIPDNPNSQPKDYYSEEIEKKDIFDDIDLNKLPDKPK